MYKHDQQIHVGKKRVKVGKNKYIYSKIMDRQTTTNQTGRIKGHKLFVKYKGLEYRVERIGFTQTYILKGKL